MKNILCIVVSSVPERISVFTQSLRPLTNNFLFFSNLRSLLNNMPCEESYLVLVDNTHSDPEVVEIIAKAKKDGSLASALIILISEYDGCPIGIKALEVGADDYLSLSNVSSELLVRTRLHVSRFNDETSALPPDLASAITNVKPDEDRRLLHDAIAYIDKNIAYIRIAQELSLQIGHTVSAINMAFRTHLDTTFSRYVLAQRINKAKNLLAETRIPITEIGMSVGYSSSSNFSTAFKKVAGVSPTQYRVSIFDN